MVRLFTLTFPFEQNQYDAQVTVDDASDTNTISVYLPDRNLHHIIPEGKTILNVEEQVKPSKDALPVEHLKYNIINAFKEHGNQSPPVNMW